jgi:hypothetical protein
MPAAQPDRKELHYLVDLLPPGEITTAKRMLEFLASAKEQLDKIDWEPETPEERAAVAEAKEWFKNHPEGIPFEEVLADHGLSIADLRKPD